MVFPLGFTQILLSNFVGTSNFHFWQFNASSHYCSLSAKMKVINNYGNYLILHLLWAWLECVAVTNPRTLTCAPEAFSEFVVLWEGAGNLAQGWQVPVSSFHLLFNWPLGTPVAWSTAAGDWNGSRGGSPACWWSWCSWLVLVLLVLQFLFLLLNLLGTSPRTSIAKLLLVKPDF